MFIAQRFDVYFGLPSLLLFAQVLVIVTLTGPCESKLSAFIKGDP